MIMLSISLIMAFAGGFAGGWIFFKKYPQQATYYTKVDKIETLQVKDFIEVKQGNKKLVPNK